MFFYLIQDRHLEFLKVYWSKAVNVNCKVCRDSVLILPAYFVNYIVRVRLSKSMWCVQLDAPNEKILVKSVMSTRKSVASQKVGDKGKITSFSVSKVLRTEPRLFWSTWLTYLTFPLIFNWNSAGRLEYFKSQLCRYSSLVAEKKWIIYINQFLFYQWFPKSPRKSSIINCLVMWTPTIFCRPVNLAFAGISPLKQLSPFLWMKSVEKKITVFSLGRSSLSWIRHSIR